MDSTVLVAALSFAGIALPILAKFIYDYRAKKANKEKHKFVNIIPAMNSLYEILSTMSFKSGAKRALVLKTENNGGRPRLGCALYSSVLYEVRSSNLPAVKPTWQRQMLDEEYTELLTHMMGGKDMAYHFHISDMDEDSILKTVYQSTGVKQAFVIGICERPKTFVYLSLTFAEDEPLTADQKDAIRIGITKLRKLFEEYEEI